MSSVVALGYLGVTAPVLDEWRELATDVLGLAISARSTDERLLLRVDDRDWRISVEPGDGGLAFCGWEVADAQALDAVRTQLRAAGHECEDDPDLAAERAVRELFRTHDPAGNRLEFFWGAAIGTKPFVSPTGAKFVTSLRSPGDMGFGHAVLTFADSDAAKKYYLDTLGFALSDTMTLHFTEQVFEVLFTRVNARHHSMAFGPGAGPTGFDHFSLEVADLDMVGHALDRVLARDLKLQLTLGRHSNDRMVSFYVVTPSGFSIEYGTGGRTIESTEWTVTNYESGSVWGHEYRGQLPVV